MLPYCWNDETPLSSHELRMDDDVYQSRQDPAITVGFRIAGDRRPTRRARYLLVWTTTPWTLPSNQAVAVNPDVDVRRGAGPDGDALRAGRRPGWRPTRASSARSPRCWPPTPVRDLLGMRYLPPFPYFMDVAQRFSGAARRLRHHRGRHRHRAHGAGLRRGRQGDHRHRRHRRRSRRSTPRAASTRRCRTTRASTSSTPTRRSSAT